MLAWLTIFGNTYVILDEPRGGSRSSYYRFHDIYEFNSKFQLSQQLLKMNYKHVVVAFLLKVAHASNIFDYEF